MKSINPDPLTPDQAIDILHRVAAAEGAPIFKDCADLIVRLHMDNFLLTKHRDEFDRLHDEARAQCDSLRTQNRELRELLTEARYLIALIGTTGTNYPEIIQRADKWLIALAQTEVNARIKEVEG